MVSAILTFIGWRNRAIPISRPFILLMAAETIWIFGYALELMSPDLPTVLLLNNIEYPAVSTVPVAWLFIVLFFTGGSSILPDARSRCSSSFLPWSGSSSSRIRSITSIIQDFTRST